MKKIIVLLTLLWLLCSCDKPVRYNYYGTDETAVKIELFVSSNMKSANNMSDEEMEDVIKELYQTAVKTYCTWKSESDKLPNERIFQ